MNLGKHCVKDCTSKLKQKCWVKSDTTSEINKKESDVKLCVFSFLSFDVWLLLFLIPMIKTKDYKTKTNCRTFFLWTICLKVCLKNEEIETIRSNENSFKQTKEQIRKKSSKEHKTLNVDVVSFDLKACDSNNRTLEEWLNRLSL